MIVNTAVIEKIQDYKITETRLVEDGKTVDVFYNILNPAGDRIGGHFDNAKEPVELLLGMLESKEAENS